MDSNTLHGKLTAIQSELKAPKSQTNKFGGYQYRSCEDILEALKPHLLKYALVLTISDEIVAIGGRVYVKATAKLWDGSLNYGPNPSTALVSVDAYAREEVEKKGMSESQITGSASSYARKYALNGLFCIDDTKDADATNDHGKAKPVAASGVTVTDVKPEDKPMSQDMYNSIISLCKQLNEDPQPIWDKYGTPDMITTKVAGGIVNALLKKRGAQVKANS